MEKAMLTVEETQRRLGVSRTMAYQLVNQKGFPAIRVGRKILVPVRQLETWINEQVEAKMNLVN